MDARKLDGEHASIQRLTQCQFTSLLLALIGNSGFIFLKSEILILILINNNEAQLGIRILTFQSHLNSLINISTFRGGFSFYEDLIANYS
jgi:hypothetical protein